MVGKIFLRDHFKGLDATGFENLNGVALELVVSGKAFPQVRHPFGLLPKKTATCRLLKLIPFREVLQAYFPVDFFQGPCFVSQR
jgi:hypothetical protein